MFLVCAIIKSLRSCLCFIENPCDILGQEYFVQLRSEWGTCSLPKVPHTSARDRSGLQAGRLNAHTFFPTPKPHCRKEHRLWFQSVLFQKKTLSEGRQMFLYMWQRTTCTLMPSQTCATDVMSSQMWKGTRSTEANTASFHIIIRTFRSLFFIFIIFHIFSKKKNK